jgi:hypothetical protein
MYLKQKKDANVSLVKDMERIDLDVKDLPRDIYYLHFTFGSDKDKQIDEIRILLN